MWKALTRLLDPHTSRGRYARGAAVLVGSEPATYLGEYLGQPMVRMRHQLYFQTTYDQIQGASDERVSVGR